MSNNYKMTFSGHESFQCRQLWLKKGYDFVVQGKSFNSDDAVVELGVGKNMVSSIRYWMKAFNLLTKDDKLTIFASKLLSDDGWDPYLEDEGSLWLLHYHLVKSGFASTYSIVFNELRKEKIEFTRDNFISLVKRKSDFEKTFFFNERTLIEDFSVMTKMYQRSNSSSKDKEDSFSGLLTDLDLIKSYTKSKEDFLIIENTERPEIPAEIILFAILDNETFDKSVNFNAIEQNYNSVGSVFAINRPGLLQKIDALTTKYTKNLTFNDHAGIKELQFKVKPTAMSILNKYYAN
ncbi:DUF4007 domain-containing protein [Chryseotalea sanaruensis]|uniref:DUF4007 domain-containing protein n=1 Tax=Chryseotalea sanaruensis TaxID=2482724 RepID=A0A401UE84_9BACT|nr:DUF4007 family protein [Chryseotalea sanaruensis]GCC53221.1 DUF4007 domain-containing protein [Chryseotalea sanaruensis]